MLAAAFLLALIPSGLAQMLSMPQTCASQCSNLVETYAKCSGVEEAEQAMACLQPLCSGESHLKLDECFACITKETKVPQSDYWALFEPYCGAHEDVHKDPATVSAAGQSESGAMAKGVPALSAVAGIVVAAAAVF